MKIIPHIFKTFPKALGRTRKPSKELKKSKKKWEAREKNEFRKGRFREEDGFKNNGFIKMLELVEKC